MNPDQNQSKPQPQYSIDYLNQIAPQTKKPGLDNKKFLLLAGGGLFLAIVIGLFVLFGSGNGGLKTKMQTLAARLQTLQTISDQSQKNIKSNALRSTNSSLSIFLTNANHDISDPLLKNGVDVKKIDKNILLAEKGTDLTNKLEDARLNAVYDRTYASEMGYQLDTVVVLLKELYNNTKSSSLKDFLVQTNDNVQPILKQLHDFNTANG